MRAVLKIENLGDKADRYFVELEGLPKTWVQIDRLELEIDPGDTAQVIISFKPLRRSEARRAIIRSWCGCATLEPCADGRRAVGVALLPFSGFGMALVPLVTPDGRFTVYVHNQGNAPLSLTLRGTDKERRLAFDLPTNHLVLGPGERQTLNGAVRPRQRQWLSNEREVGSRSPRSRKTPRISWLPYRDA